MHYILLKPIVIYTIANAHPGRINRAIRREGEVYELLHKFTVLRFGNEGLTARKHIRIAEGERRHNGQRSIALKARENLRQLAKYDAVALEYATRAFCATKFIARMREKGERTMRVNSIVPIAADLYNVKFIRKGGKKSQAKRKCFGLSQYKYKNSLITGN